MKDNIIILRRDGKSPLRFTGERIGTATRTQELQNDRDQETTYETSVELWLTAGGKYVLGYEVYDRTNDSYDSRDAYAGTLEEVVAAAQRSGFPNLDKDILAEVFEDTEVADQFVEQID